MEAWHDFFVALVGANAALVGLLFVALSINLAQIMKYAWLPARGGQTLVVLTGALVLSALPLLPDANAEPVALISFLVALATWIFSIVLVRSYVLSALKQSDVAVSTSWTRSYSVAAQFATLPALVGGVLGLLGNADAYYWIAAGLLTTVVFALYNSWVLLVEILR
jgi:modulator of FtsH protease